MERDQGAAAIGRRETRPVIDSQIVGGPVPREGGDRRPPLRANANRLAIAAIFRREHQLVLLLVKVALGPAIVGAGEEPDQLLGRQFRALLGIVEARPILKELIATMLGREQSAGVVEGEALAISQAAHETLLGRKDLSRLVGVIEPRAGARLLLGAWVVAGRVGNAIFELTGIGRRAEIDKQPPFRVDHERVHGMVAGQRQAGQHHGGWPDRQRCPRSERIAQDAAVFFGKKRVVVKRNAAAAGPTLLHPNAKALNEIGASFARGVLQSDEKTARRRRRVGKVAAAPGVGVERAVRGCDKMADMAEIVGKYRGAKSRRKGEAAVVAQARRFLSWSVAAGGADTSGHSDNRRQNGERRGN
jgi:hypothetical protein